jgi:hypothetical protein
LPWLGIWGRKQADLINNPIIILNKAVVSNYTFVQVLGVVFRAFWLDHFIIDCLLAAVGGIMAWLVSVVRLHFVVWLRSSRFTTKYFCTMQAGWSSCGIITCDR